MDAWGIEILLMKNHMPIPYISTVWKSEPQASLDFCRCTAGTMVSAVVVAPLTSHTIKPPAADTSNMAYEVMERRVHGIGGILEFHDEASMGEAEQAQCT